MRSTQNRVLAALFTLSTFSCSNPPPDADYTSGNGASGGSAPTAGTTGSGGTSPGSGGSAGTSVVGGSAGTSVVGGAAGTAGTGGSSVPGVMGHPDPAVTYPTYPGFTLALVEEFNAPLDLVTDPIWTYSDGGLGEGAVRFKKDAITFDGGLMKITVREEYTASSHSYAENSSHYEGLPADKTLVSGELRTKYNNFRYGRYEARFKAPTPNPDTAKLGNFIHTLFTFRTPKFQDWREIDIEVTGASTTEITTNVIYGDNKEFWGGDFDEAVSTYPTGNGAMAVPATFHARNDFHTYAFEWTPTQIRWYIDDVLIRVKDPGTPGVDEVAFIPDKSAKIMMNLWVFDGTGFGGNPLENVYPFTAEYDWFRFYKLDTETTYPCSPTPDCLPAEDKDGSKNNAEDGIPDDGI